MTDNTHLGHSQPPALSSDSPLSAKGRLGRLSYLAWLFVTSMGLYIAVFIVALLSGGFSSIMGGAGSEALGGGLSVVSMLIFAVLYIALIYFLFVFTIRRLHDVNKTGWLSLLIIVPLVNIFFTLYILFAKGTEGPNNYGPKRPTLGWEKVVGWIYIVLTVISLLVVIVFSGSIIKALSQQGSYSGESIYSEQISDGQYPSEYIGTEQDMMTETPAGLEPSMDSEPAASAEPSAGAEQPVQNP